MRGIGGDALAVGLGQLAAFIYPIISLPMLTRLLGVNAFGRVVITVAVLQLLVRLCDYGFSVSAVRRMAMAKSERERSEVIFSTLLAVVLLWSTGACVLLLAVSIIPSRDDFVLYLVGGGHPRRNRIPLVAAAGTASAPAVRGDHRGLAGWP
ncbi:lipopolysaccharide biosynthesis protein [Brevibacterium aurantiacum]|uniref:lipopolysaccharide biosynthesis protein n=1 Tax=Brevibacterium aurantiacum TaxID=273384 RepID=UPI0013DDB3C2|nr:oligosaccharide flippase family protein [Brevibacterium aurantiacum]